MKIEEKIENSTRSTKMMIKIQFKYFSNSLINTLLIFFANYYFNKLILLFHKYSCIYKSDEIS